MELFLIITFNVLLALIIIYFIVFLYIFDKKRKEFIHYYEKLLTLKNWYEKVSDEATRSHILDRVEKRGYELIDHLNILNTHLSEFQKHHEKLQEQQKDLHNNLLKEHQLLNEYFENYS